MATKGERLTEAEWHRKTAADLFNGVWRVLDKSRRTQAEEDWIVHAAHASRHHWGAVGTPANVAVGEWQVSHVYAVLGRAEPATHHARRCLALCRRNGVQDYPLAFAYEALARADAVAGRARDLRHHLAQGYRAGLKIADKEDREEFFRQLATVARSRPPRRGRAAPRG